MRTLLITNANGDSVTLGYDIFGLTSLTGCGIANVNNQEQRAPFQDGSTYIDALFDPRELVCEGVIAVGLKLADIATYRRELCHVLNPKLGACSIVYTNDNGSYLIYGVPNGPEFANFDPREGNQKYQVTFHCNDPYWQDVNETVINLASGSADVAITVTGDVETAFEADLTGLSRDPLLKEMVQNKALGYSGCIDTRLKYDTSFGNKTAMKYYDNSWQVTAFPRKRNLSQDGELQLLASGSGILGTVDGENWAIRDGHNGIDYIAYSSFQRLWVGGTDIGNFYTSQDGQSWTYATFINTVPTSMSYSETLNLWCFTTVNGDIYTSTDGISWTRRVTGGGTLSDALLCSYYASGLWVVAGGTGGVAAKILVSVDGITWTPKTSPINGSLNSVHHSSTLNQWCAVGDVGIITSGDGNTWTSRDTGLYNSVWYSTELNLWCVVGGTNDIKTSTNGISWTSRTSGASGGLYCVTYSTLLSKFVAAGFRFYGSSDGITWTPLTNGIIPEYLGAGFGGVGYSATQNKWVVCGSFGFVSQSANGKDWTTIDIGSVASAGCVSFSEHLNQWACPFDGDIWTSSDATAWTKRTTGLTATRLHYSKIQNQWCAIGSGGAIYTSPDGVIWTSRTSGTTGELRDIYYSALLDQWVVAGTFEILTSTDCITWARTSFANIIFYGVGYSNYLGQWCVVGKNNVYPGSGYIITSIDGSTWTPRAISTSADIKGIYFDEDQQKWFAGSDEVFESIDGITWDAVYGTSGYGFLSAQHDRINNISVSVSDDYIFYSLCGGNVSVIQNLSQRDFFQLQPGRNVLSLTASTGNVSALVKYRNRYTGI